MVKYNEVKNTFKEHNCKLLMTEEEFNLKPRKTNEKYPYIASCGDNNEICFHNFKHNSQGLKCPKCVNLKKSIDKKEKYKLNPVLTNDLEFESIEYLKTIIMRLNLMAKVVWRIVVLNLNISRKILG